MNVRRKFLFLALASAASLCACSGPSTLATGVVVHPHAGEDNLPDRTDGPKAIGRIKGYFQYEPPILPIKFIIDTDLNFSISVESTFVSPLGRITYGAGVDGQARIPRISNSQTSVSSGPYGTTRLIICQQGSDRHNCQGYDVATGRKLRIDMDGQFQEVIERNLITIDAASGSTITVTDSGPPAQAGPHPAARIDIEEFDFSVQSQDTEVDLERSQGGTTPDLSYDHMTGELKPAHGASVSQVKKYAGVAGNGILDHDHIPDIPLPSENDCAQTAPSAWQSTFTSIDLQADVILACIGTAEGDYGFIVLGRDASMKPVAYYAYTYTWVR